ncbi:MAG: hypothetical protein HC874_14250 [Richelia sp. SL_2_1]|nr:hypothetical protein [Richelia sp. SL_2_1]
MRTKVKNDHSLQRNTNTDFVRVVTKKFKLWADARDLEHTPENFARYMLIHLIIDFRTVNRYMVLELYPEQLYRCDGSKSKAVLNLEDMLPYQERMIWNLISDQKRFRASLDIEFEDFPDISKNECLVFAVNNELF